MLWVEHRSLRGPAVLEIDAGQGLAACGQGAHSGYHMTRWACSHKAAKVWLSTEGTRTLRREAPGWGSRAGTPVEPLGSPGPRGWLSIQTSHLRSHEVWQTLLGSDREAEWRPLGSPTVWETEACALATLGHD